MAMIHAKTIIKSGNISCPDNVFSKFILLVMIVSTVTFYPGKLKAEAEADSKILNTSGNTIKYYKKYYNDRFNFEIEYPSNILSQKFESDNNDGVVFSSGDEKILLTASGIYNALDKSPSELYNDVVGDYINKGGEITYKTLKGNWFVVSGFLNGKIFYRKSIVEKELIVSADLLYDKKSKELVDVYMKKIMNSLKIMN
ncbi:MAG: hypothetical protein H7833_01980 [Magnetococcus sp. DMHC-1]|nr:hypothetical protein [Magnetococcales bacterium]